MSVAINIERDTASPWLAQLRREVTPQRMAAKLGPRCTRLLQRTFLKLGTNERGWPTTNFWARAAKATNWQPGDGYLLVGTNQIGVRQRYFGGDIRPVNAKALTIPASKEAYGKRAGDFGNLVFKLLLDPESGKLRPALTERAGSKQLAWGRKKKDGSRPVKVVSQATGLVPLFWLVRSVHQKGNPAVMPTDAEWQAEFQAAVQTILPK